VGAIVVAAPVWWMLAPAVTPDRYGSATAFLSAVLFFPVLEELCFRGFLQPCLWDLAAGRRQWCGLSLANLATSLAFAVAHLPGMGLWWSAAVIAPSLVFGHLRDRSGSVLPPMALHAYYNGGLMLCAYARAP
jgi:uncharacterized protein